MFLLHFTGIDQFFFPLSLLSLVIIVQRLNFIPIFPFYFVVFTFVRKSWGNKKRLSRHYSASWFEIVLWAVSYILRLFYDFLFSLTLSRVYGISWAMLPTVSLHCSSQLAMLLFVLLVWRLYFAADTYILSPHNSTTVDCRSDESDSSLSEVHRYSLSLFCFPGISHWRYSSS